MQNQINTSVLTQFIQSVRSAELNQQREVKMTIQQARLLSLALAEIQTKLVQDYETLYHALKTVAQSSSANINIEMDGGSFE